MKGEQGEEAAAAKNLLVKLYFVVVSKDTQDQRLVPDMNFVRLLQLLALVCVVTTAHISIIDFRFSVSRLVRIGR